MATGECCQKYNYRVDSAPSHSVSLLIIAAEGAHLIYIKVI